MWKHDALAHDLAQHLRENSARMVWEDMQLGPSGSPRPDVFTLAKSYSRPMPTTYEVKISRSDFLADCNAGKWQKYLAFSAGVFFAVPEGLIKRDEVPPGCGLIVRHEKVWRSVKAPRWGKCEIGGDVAMKLLIDGLPRLGGRAIRVRVADEYRLHEKLRRKHGEEVGNIVRDLHAARRMVEYYKDEEERVRKNTAERIERERQNETKQREQRWAQADRDARECYAVLCDALGLPATASTGDIKRRLNKAIRTVDADARVREAERQLGAIRRALDEAETIKPTERVRRQRAAAKGKGVAR